MTTLIGLLAIALVLILLFQVSKAGEYLGELRGEKPEEVNGKAVSTNNNFQGTMFLVTLVLGMAAIIYSVFFYADKFLFLKEPMAFHSISINSMYFATLFAIIPVFIATHILLFWFAFKYRRDENRSAVFYPDNNKLEMLWIGVPAVVMVFLVLRGMQSWLQITNIDSPKAKNAMIIEATAQQFKWDIRYSGADNVLGVKRVQWMTQENPYGLDWEDKAVNDDFMPIGDIVLLKDRPVLVKINSLDVLHNFYLPHFNVKMDAVPGIPTQFWFIPTKSSEEAKVIFNDPDFVYELACAELCGKSHFNMRRELVVVETEAEYNAWVAEQKTMYAQRKEAAANAGIDLEEEKEEQTADAKAEETESNPLSIVE